MVQEKQEISINLPIELLMFVDKASKVGTDLCICPKRDETEAVPYELLMIEGYKAMSEGNRKLAEKNLAASMETCYD